MMTLAHAWNSLVTILFQSAALCLITGAGLLLLRKSASSTRHLLLILSMGALLVVPLLALFLPHWQVPLYKRTPVPASAERFANLAQDPAPSLRSDVPLSPSGVSLPAASGSVSLTRPFPAQVSRSIHSGSMSVPFASAGERRIAHGPVWQTARCQQAVLAIWMLGAVLTLLRLLAGLIGTQRVTSRETVSDPLLSQTVAQIQKELGLARAVTVRKTRAEGGLPVPLTWGLFRPTLLLPPAFLEWPQERQRMVVLHELAHIQRADWLVQVLVQITLALYWFHPLVWWASRRLQAESERACDDSVLLTGVAPSAYAETLLEVLRTMNRSQRSAAPSPSMLSMAQPPIEARLQAILSPQQRQRPARRTMLLASAGTALGAVLLASVQVQAVQAPPTPAHPSHVPGVSNAPAESAFPAQPIASAPGSDASLSRLASPQSGAENLVMKSLESRDEQDIPMLRKRLDTLELLLVHNQEENARLRQQIKDIDAANNRVTSVEKTVASASKRPLSSAPSSQTTDQNRETEAYRRTEASRTSPDTSPTVPRDTLQNVLEELERQKVTLEAQAQRAENRYRGPGFVSYQEGLDLKIEMDLCKLQIGALQKQIDDVKAGRKVSATQLNLSKLHVQLAKLEVRMAREQEIRAKALTRYPVTAFSRSDLLKADRKVALLQTQIDQVVGKFSQKSAH